MEGHPDNFDIYKSMSISLGLGVQKTTVKT